MECLEFKERILWEIIIKFLFWGEFSELMSSKTAKKAKTATSGENKKTKYSIPAEGALDPQYLVNALMRDNKWYKARIIDCRLVKGIIHLLGK
jgi:hypothetical protein